MVSLVTVQRAYPYPAGVWRFGRTPLFESTEMIFLPFLVEWWSCMVLSVGSSVI